MGGDQTRELENGGGFGRSKEVWSIVGDKIGDISSGTSCKWLCMLLLMF